MAKNTPTKRIKAQLTNKVQRQYKDKMDSYEERLSNLSYLLRKERERTAILAAKCAQLDTENAELRQTNEQYTEWIERMQDFCNMPEGKRQDAFNAYLEGIKAKSEADEAMARIGRMYGTLTSLFLG